MGQSFNNAIVGAGGVEARPQDVVRIVWTHQPVDVISPRGACGATAQRVPAHRTGAVLPHTSAPSRLHHSPLPHTSWH